MIRALTTPTTFERVVKGGGEKLTKRKSEDSSRSKKAITVAFLVEECIKTGVKVKFTKSKVSKSELKVLRGDEVIINNKSFKGDDFMIYSEVFVSHLNSLIEDLRTRRCKELELHSSNLFANEMEAQYYKGVLNIIASSAHSPGSYNTPRNSESVLQKWKDLDYNQECRNKEACFVNFLSMYLVLKGYTLITNVTRIKQSKKTTHFFIWNGIVRPNSVNSESCESNGFEKESYTVNSGNKLQIMESEGVISFIDYIERLLNSKNSIVLEDQDLLGMEEMRSLSKSVFKPVCTDFYTVIDYQSV